MQNITKMQKILFAGILALLIVLGSILTAWMLGAFTKTEVYDKQNIETITIPEATNKLSGDYFGVLVLGSDEGATKTNGGNHTDSVTYVAINIKTKKAYALPIYRDAYVYNQCTNSSININHIYRDNGAECLVSSVQEMLKLPVDYYIYITSNGFVDLFNTIGPLSITPEASFDSKYGNDENIYHFDNGVTQEMNGNQLLAYTRFRGNTSGELRAMRHIQVLNKAYEKCLEDPIKAITAIANGMIKNDIQTDLPYQAVFDLKNVTQLELLSTLSGTNFQDDAGWHQRINENDLIEKTEKIKAEIFS